MEYMNEDYFVSDFALIDVALQMPSVPVITETTESEEYQFYY